MKVQELFEAKARRAWEGNLKKIDELFSWMYDRNILTATEKKKKDTVFRQYYRYYNDGDYPAGLKTSGVSKWDGKAKVEAALEEYLEKFVKEILTKYLPKIDRTEFRIDNLLKELKTLKSVASRADAYALLNYWLKKVKIGDSTGELKTLVSKLEKTYAAAEAAFNKANPAGSNTTMSYRVQDMDKAGTMTPELRKHWLAVKTDCAAIENFIDDLSAATSKLKKEKLTD